MSKMNKKTVALHNLGCKVNAYETEAMQEMMEEAGFQIVNFGEIADIYIINTCSVTNMADRKSRQMLHQAKKRNPHSIVVAAGCYVQTKTEEALKDAGVDIIIGNNKKHELIEILKDYENKREISPEGKRVQVKAVLPINHPQEYEQLSHSKTAGHTRAFIKVQDGCNQFCSYCIIPYARGRARSRKLEHVLREAEELACKGYKEIVLTGIHLSSYGMDTGDSLLHLIEETAKTDGICRIRLGSLEPRVVTEEFAEKLSRIDKICPHFHLSLQSGCDSTLQRMNRKYTTAEYENCCNLLRKYFCHPAITTDVIAGFPGETEEEFKETFNYLEKIQFYEMHIFKYSRREGTKAALMQEQIPEPVKTARSEKLIALGEKMSEKFREYYVGKETEVLMEETFLLGDKKYYTGHTKEYVKAAVETEGDLSNTLIRGKVKGRLTEGVYLI